MKPVSIALVSLSVAANIALGFLVFKNLNPSSAINASAGDATTAKPQVATPASPGEIWSKLESQDFTAAAAVGKNYGGFRDRLRALGFPDNITNSIIEQQVRQHFAVQLSRIESAPSDEFWNRNWDLFFILNRKARTEVAAVSKQEREALRAALGKAYTNTQDFRDMMKRGLQNIPEEKALLVQLINEDYQDISNDSQAWIYSNITLREDQEKMLLWEKEKRADIANVLTPKELEDYELRTSDVASSLRYTLTSFAPNEQEFRSLFMLQQEFQLNHPEFVGDQSDAAAKGRQLAEKNLEEKIKATLGEARYVDYQRAQDYSFRRLSDIAQRMEIPRETVIAVYDFSKDVQARATQLRNQDMTYEAQQKAMASLVEEMNTKLNQSLGPGGARAYKETGGQWIARLKD